LYIILLFDSEKSKNIFCRHNCHKGRNSAVFIVAI